MTGINALSDSLKGGNKLGKTSTQKGKDVADSSENAADIFAAILGSMNLNVTSKGQKSSIAEAGQEMEGMQIVGDSQQQPQKGDVLMGYGSLAFPLMTQFMLQGNIPAGKEANSGNVVDQGTGQLLTANVQSANVQGAGAIEGSANFGQVLANSAVVSADEVPQVSDESLATTGMVSLKSQSGNPAITELDKYKQVIAGLLEALSGEISSPQGTGTQLGLEKETVVVSQDVMKLSLVRPD